MITIDGNTPYLRLDVNGAQIKVQTNIVRIDRDQNNPDNKKLFFIQDSDYTNLIPYQYVNNLGVISFYDSLPSCQVLTALIKVNNKIQYETNKEFSRFYVSSSDPTDGEGNVAPDKIITVNTNTDYKVSDLTGAKVYLTRAGSSVKVAGVLTSTSSSQFTFNPDSNLTTGTSYVLKIDGLRSDQLITMDYTTITFRILGVIPE